MLRVLGHYSRLLGFKDANVTLQLLIALLEGSVRELTTAQVSPNLLLFLVAAELK